MYDTKSIDLVAEGLKFLQDIKPLLDSPERVQDFISGVAEAKQFLANAQEIEARLDRAEKLEVKNAADAQHFKQLADDAKAATVALTTLQAEINQKKLDAEAALRTAEATLADASVKFGNAKKLQADAEDLFARAETELHDAKALKGEYQTKLNALIQAEG
jgi:uncharacterized protein (UPF0335 family)